MPFDGTPESRPLVAEEARRIAASPKYRVLAPETVEDVVRRQFERCPAGGRRAALAAARRTLHRVAAFYLGEPDYEAAAARIEAARGNDAAMEAVCRELLGRHASTRERLGVMAELYGSLFARVGPPRSLADLASGCNPFAFRWMGLDRSVRYRAYDINRNMVSLVNRYFAADGVAGEAMLRDVLCSPPEEPADVALLLKMYHCLERRRRGAGWEVVARAPAACVAVSFPSRNMRGLSADIAGNYRPEIEASAAAAGWRVEELAVDGEVVLLVRKAAR